MEGPATKRSSRDEIFAAAIQLFSERGYSSTSIRDIAGAVGLLPGSLYAHISGKEQLLSDIVESGVDRFIEACGATLESDERAETHLRLAIRAHIQVIAADAEHVRVALHQWKYLTGENRERIVEKRRRYEDIFKQIVESGIERGELSAGLNPRIAVLSIIGALNWASEWFHADGPETAEEVAEEIAEVLLAGLLREHG